MKTPNPIAHLPIEYHLAVKECFWELAADLALPPHLFWKHTEEVIRTRHAEAFIEHESHRARGQQPDIFTLKLSERIWVVYTVEAGRVVVRGYGQQLDHEPLDDFDGGFFFWDAAWL